MRALHLLLTGTLALSACHGEVDPIGSTPTPSDTPSPPGTLPPGETPPGTTDMSTPPTPEPDMSEEVDMPTTPPPPSVASGNDLTSRQNELFQCSGEVSASPARLRLLDRKEWARNVSLGTPASNLSPFDPLQSHPFSTYVDGESINAEILDVYMNMSGVAADAWKGPGDWERSLRWSSPFKFNPRLVENVGPISCVVDERSGTPDDTCLTDFVTFLLENAVLYRPATAEEVGALRDYARAALDRESATPTRGERRDTIRQIVQAAWMTTGALFRKEGFDNPPDADGLSELSDGEVAQALAFALGNIAPGAIRSGTDARGVFPKIVEAAQAGTIKDPGVLEALIREYLVHDQATNEYRSVYATSDGVLNFFREWLGYTLYLELTKDAPEATTAYTNEQLKTTYHYTVNGTRHSGSSREPRLVEMLDAVISRILFEDRDVFHQLLTTRDYYVAADVGKDGGSPNLLFNLSNSPAPTQAGRWVTLPSTERAGVLTHPAWLASHSLNFENDPNPVHRGKWIRENLLCGEIPPTPITVEAALDPETKDQSTRARVQAKTEQPACLGCHRLMNPLGYAFETYNHIGVLRADDHGGAPDGSAVLELMPDPDLNGPVRDAVELSEKLAGSAFVKRCFIRQSFRYFMGRDETMADACILNQMETAYDQQGSFQAMLVTLFTSPAFLTRRHAQGGTP